MMEIIDSQLHEFGPWMEWPHEQPLQDRVAVELALAAMDAVGVDAAVISARDDLSEYAATAFPDRFASISSVNDPAEAGIEERIAAIRRGPGVLGLRVVVGTSGERIEMLKNGAFDPIFAAAQKHSVPVCFFVSGYLPLTHDVVRKFPDLHLVLDHFGLRQPPLQEPDDPPFRRLQELLDLAVYPNVSVKFSGAPSLSRQPYPFEDIWPHLMRVIDAFKPERLMWGTDITRVHNRFPHRQPGPAPASPEYVGQHTYAEGVLFLKASDRLSEGDKEQIFGASLRRIMGWPVRS